MKSSANPSRSPEALRFERYLHAKGLKLTSERLAILAAISRRQRHFGAEDLHADLRAEKSGVSRATVYRTLDLLVQCRLVSKSTLGASHASYEAVRENEHHDHLICLNCNKIIEFFRPDLEQLQDSICRDKHFKPFSHNLRIFGLCKACTGKTDESAMLDRMAQLHT